MSSYDCNEQKEINAAERELYSTDIFVYHYSLKCMLYKMFWKDIRKYKNVLHIYLFGR